MKPSENPEDTIPTEVERAVAKAQGYIDEEDALKHARAKAIDALSALIGECIPEYRYSKIHNKTVDTIKDNLRKKGLRI